MNAFNKRINKEEADINKDLFKEHFNFQRPSCSNIYTEQMIEKKIINQ